MTDERSLRSLGRWTSAAVAAGKREEDHCKFSIVRQRRLPASLLGGDPPTYNLVSVADKMQIAKWKNRRKIIKNKSAAELEKGRRSS
jgi:hypothetical protein